MNHSPSSTGNMPNSSKKRKAAEVDPENDNGSTPKPKSGKRRAKQGKQTQTTADTVPFRTYCPLKKREGKGDNFYGSEQLTDTLKFDYAVRPGEKWKAMRSYKNVKYSEHTFTIGGIVYINKQDPPPEPPAADASDAEILAYDRENFWVARIADTRAANEKAVYLRVTWLYWPEELPMGRQSYHSDHELILSNAMDIVDATTISWTAEVIHWDESDVDAKIGNRFWRQTLDVGALGADKKGGLSSLKKHCRCQQPHNPDEIMFLCKDPACGTWNHERCLIRDLTEKAEDHYRRGTLDSVAKQDNNENARILSPIKDFGKYVQNKLKPTIDAVAEQALPHFTNGSSLKQESPSRKRNRSKVEQALSSSAKAATKSDFLSVTIPESEDNDAPVRARVEEVASSALKQEDGVNGVPPQRIWILRVDCLKCGKTMD